MKEQKEQRGQKEQRQWEEAQVFERDWWGNCANTVWEDVKQMNLAKYLGLKIVPNAYTNFRIPLSGQSVLDIGGGPSSILLKCENVSGTVIDPCNYPEWVGMRYKEAGINYHRIKGEDIPINLEYDEVWIYNVLQHTQDPKCFVEKALAVSGIIRVFEWVEIGTNDGHPHSFTKEILEGYFKGEGKVVNLNSGGLYGKAFYGIFLGEHYGTQTREI